LYRRHAYNVLQVRNICSELCELGLQVGKLARFLRWDGAQSRGRVGLRLSVRRHYLCSCITIDLMLAVTLQKFSRRSKYSRASCTTATDITIQRRPKDASAHVIGRPISKVFSTSRLSSHPFNIGIQELHDAAIQEQESIASFYWCGCYRRRRFLRWSHLEG
jgi:hypothetical protein